MPALARFNPFRAPARFESPAFFDEFFRTAGMPSPWREPTLAPEMRVDITEDDKAFRIKAEVPGVDKDDIEVSVQGNQVSISAEVKRETRKEDEREVVVERSFGRAYRAFALPVDVDNSRTEARYEKGVLMLTLPKKVDGTAHRIAVS